MSERIDAVLPAGGRIAGDFAREAGAEVKALIRLGGGTLLERAISVGRETGRIGRIAVIGPPEIAEAARGADALLPEGRSGPENLFRGIHWLEEQGGAHRVVILTTDLPFVTAESVAAFLAACPPEADICLPVIHRSTFEARFPGSPNTWVRLREGEVTMGCAFLVNPHSLAANRAHLDRVFAARKSQLAMARLLGPLFVARFFTRRLKIAHIEARCQHILGCTGAAISGCDPALAFDIDEPADYRYARAASDSA